MFLYGPTGHYYEAVKSRVTWSAGEPNNGGGEDYLAFLWGDTAEWNDVPQAWDVNAGYIVEYGPDE